MQNYGGRGVSSFSSFRADVAVDIDPHSKHEGEERPPGCLATLLRVSDSFCVRGRSTACVVDLRPLDGRSKPAMWVSAD